MTSLERSGPGTVRVTGEPADSPSREQARMPVPPLLMDLAGWGWRLGLLAVLSWGLLQAAQRVYLVSLPLAAALLMTALLSPLVDGLRRRGLPPAAAVGVVIVTSLVLMSAVLTWVVNRAVGELPDLFAQLTSGVERLPFRSVLATDWRDRLVEQLRSHQGDLTESVLTGLLVGAEVLTGLLLTLLLTLILLSDGDRMWDWLVARLPEPAQPRLRLAGRHAYARLSGWIRGTFVIAIFHALIVTVALLLLGAPLVAPLAILVFLGSFIPIVGAVIFGALAVLVTFAAQGLTPAIVLAVVLLVDNQIEAHVLQPFLVGRYVRLHPFVVALVITAGGVLAGLAGALLAVPLTAAVYAALTHLEPPAPRSRRRSRRLTVHSRGG